MTMLDPHPPPVPTQGTRQWSSRRRALVAVAAAVVVLAAAVGVFVTVREDKPTPSQAPSPTAAASSSPSSGGTPISSVQPADGCLGGSDPATAVLAAERTAPRTGDGAAAFLASAVRWSVHQPSTGAENAAANKVWFASTPKKAMTADELQKLSGYRTADATFVGASYKVLATTSSTAKIAFGYGIVGDGAVVAHAFFVVDVQWVDGHWRMRSGDQATTDDWRRRYGKNWSEPLAATGVRYQGPC